MVCILLKFYSYYYFLYEQFYNLLWDAGIVESLPLTVVLPFCEHHPPAVLERSENPHVQGLQQVGGVLWQEYKSNVVFLAEAGHNRRQMGGQVVTDEKFYFFFRDGSDVA